jgi:hypothetical protein
MYRGYIQGNLFINPYYIFSTLTEQNSRSNIMNEEELHVAFEMGFLGGFTRVMS